MSADFWIAVPTVIFCALCVTFTIWIVVDGRRRAERIAQLAERLFQPDAPNVADLDAYKAERDRRQRQALDALYAAQQQQRDQFLAALPVVTDRVQ